MSTPVKTEALQAKHLADIGAADGRLGRPAVGMEAEFELMVDGRKTRPEDLFGDPRAFLQGSLMHRVGTSYSLPTGGAIYFDTGVIEVATPVIEIERGCAARAGRSLWESIRHIRADLDAWEQGDGRRTKLVGFSTHYNVSFDRPDDARGGERTVEQLALLLAYVLPIPVMLLAANRRSTGIGVRPRGNRIEVTADFTPSPSLMIATGALITGIVREVMAWPSYGLDELVRRGLPTVRGYAPVPHTSRQGWLARFDSYPRNPFTCDIDAAVWSVQQGPTGIEEPARRSLRSLGDRIFRRFWWPIARIADPFTFKLIGSVLSGRAPSLLELPDRPAAYEDVGRLCTWDELFPEAMLTRSRYERVLIRAIAGRHLTLDGERLTPTGLRGWSQVVFSRDSDRTRHVIPLDTLVTHLDSWD